MLFLISMMLRNTCRYMENETPLAEGKSSGKPTA
jgi:hypothetical protein